MLKEFLAYVKSLNKSKIVNWRDRYRFTEKYGIDLEGFENEDDFLRFYDSGEYVKAVREYTEEKHSIGLDRKRGEEKVLHYCGVKFVTLRPKIYYYLTGDNEVHVGDTVLVPAGEDNEETSGKVVCVGEYGKSVAPYPEVSTKTVIEVLRRCDHNCENE